VPSSEAVNTFVTTNQCAFGATAETQTTQVSNGDVIILPTSGSQWFCIDADEDSGDVTIDSNDYGTWSKCLSDEGTDTFVNDNCPGTTGLGTDNLIVLDDQNTNGSTNVDVLLVLFNCQANAGTANVIIYQSDAPTVQSKFTIQCRAQPSGISLTASPTTVEIIPAFSNTAHSLIQVTALDATGAPALAAPGTEVDFTVNQGPLLGTGPLGLCAIEESNVDEASQLQTARTLIAALTTAIPASYFNWDGFANDMNSPSGDKPPTPSGLNLPEQIDTISPRVDASALFDIDIGGGVIRSMAAAILHCDPHAGIPTPLPGFVTVQACVDITNGADICQTVQVTVIGPPASITVAASPTSVRCGEKSTITVTVKDAVGQNVSDHTVVEMVSNLGGTIGGTGAVAGFGGPVVPISSSVAGTFGGVATAFLLTSDTHEGPYEVVATTGGTTPINGDPFFGHSDTDTFTDAGHVGTFPGFFIGRTDGESSGPTTLGGIFSTPPISAEVTVTCNIPAPTAAAPAATVTAPKTGTGVTPPNTGDAGLKGSSSSSWTLFALGGLAAFALAGLATAKFARR
jgi:hypothetical protein